MATRRTQKRNTAEPRLTEQGAVVFRYDKNKDGTNARFVNAKPGTVWHELLSESPGWYPVDPGERHDYEAAQAAAEGKAEEFDEQERRQGTRVGQLSSVGGYARGRGRPSKAEQAALAERDEAVRVLADKDAEIEALRARLAELDDAAAGSGGGEGENA